MFIYGFKGWKGIGRSLLTTPRSEKNKNFFPYLTDYFGHKRHIDQSEKLVMYGVKHVLASDCHSRFIAAFLTIPIKDDAIIYGGVYRYLFYNLEL